MPKWIALLLLSVISLIAVSGIHPCCTSESSFAVAQDHPESKKQDHGSECLSCLQCGNMVSPSVETACIAIPLASSVYRPRPVTSLFPSPYLPSLHRPPIA